jgi:hypothetical protein
MNDSDFDDLLRSARGESPSPHSFQSGVWRRIENDAAQVGLRPWYMRAFAAVAKPWITVAGLAATVTLGLWLGTVTSAKQQPTASEYAYSISPFAQTHH